MVKVMVKSANTLVKTWESRLNQTDGVALDLPIHDYVRSFSSNVISNILFGSNFKEGNMIFPKYRALLNAMASPTILNGVPFSRSIKFFVLLLHSLVHSNSIYKFVTPVHVYPNILIF